VATVTYIHGHAEACFPIAVARVRVRFMIYEICVGRIDSEEGFLQLLLSSLPITPSIAPHLSLSVIYV
jgi:hypothetical protein